MAFNSVIFGAFFAVFLLIYYNLPRRFQLYWVLLSSCAFYAYTVPYYLILIFITICVDFYVTKNIGLKPDQKKPLLYFSLLVNLSILFSFKYLDFTISNVNEIAKFAGWNYSINSLKLILPIGLSFYIFKSMSHVIDVYRGNCKPDESFIEYAAYVLFFPEVLSGPIDRSHNLLPQLRLLHSFNSYDIKYGLKLFAWGLFKKVVIADKVAISVDHVYGNIYNYHGIPLIITILFYAFQIYCDFSGYSDMAIGCGKMMGFNLQNNFNMPYLALSIADFWRRWHITLSNWFRDYVFLPLSYSSLRKFMGKRILGLKDQMAAYTYASIITMFLVGLWHGASWTFIVWGLYLGFLLALSRITKKYREKFKRAIGLNTFKTTLRLVQITITFSLISVSWVFFRASSLNEAVYVLTHLFTSISLKTQGQDLGISFFNSSLSLFFILGLVSVESLLKDNENPVDLISRLSVPSRWVIYYIIVILILCFGEFGAKSFVYFQF